MPTEAAVHVVDDDDGVRESLLFVLESAGHKVFTYASAELLLAVAPRLKSGCVVSDIRMPGMNGLEMIRAMRAKGCALPVIVITGHGDVPLAVEAMRAGASEFLEKPFDDELFLKAVSTALKAAQAATEDEATQHRFRAMLATLSGRETEVLRGLVLGQSNKAIGRDLGISPRTVEVYRGHLMTKTGAGSLSELVRIAILAKF
ncbi:MAG: response regulator [Proteobacteria bacterium]|nr:response regulator [Pseudomonadota bacterium]